MDEIISNCKGKWRRVRFEDFDSPDSHTMYDQSIISSSTDCNGKNNQGEEEEEENSYLRIPDSQLACLQTEELQDHCPHYNDSRYVKRKNDFF